MRFFLDHCVPTAVELALKEAGHDVILLRQVISPDSSDTLVAIASATNDAILVTFDSDFKAIASRITISHKRLKKLSRLQFRCTEPEAAGRLKAAMSWIEHEWEVTQKSADKRMFLEILGHGLKSLR